VTASSSPKADSVAEAARKSWYAFKHFNAGSSQDPMISYLAGYRRGVADVATDAFGLGGWDALTRRLLKVLEDLLDTREAVRMVTDEEAPAGELQW